MTLSSHTEPRAIAGITRVLDTVHKWRTDHVRRGGLLLREVSRRVYATALGYEDINDHDEFRRDALLATLAGEADSIVTDRVCERDLGLPLAGKSTLSRLDLAPSGTEPTHQYHKIVCPQAVDPFFVDTFQNTYLKPQKRVILVFDANSHPRERPKIRYPRLLSCSINRSRERCEVSGLNPALSKLAGDPLDPLQRTP